MALIHELKAIQKKHPWEMKLAELIHGFRAIREQSARAEEADTSEHILEHLKTALQGAVTLEFATLPPYLCAIWSVKDDLHPVAKSLREVLQEEMLHMALACNMLVAIGGKPKINTALPIYPGKLPLHVHPELTVHLSGLTRQALTAFLEIERPFHPGHHIALKAADELRADDSFTAEEAKDLTIGEFYDEILAAFKSLGPALSTDRQITGPLAPMVITNLTEVENAINTIKREGEGSEGPPDTEPDDLAHYFRFAEIIELKKLTYNEATGDYEFTTPIAFNQETDVWPMGVVPEGGYTDDKVSDTEVRRLLRSFNLTYSKLIDLLQSIWEADGGQANFWHAIDTMFELEKYSKPLMQIPRPDGAGNYGPDFRYIPKEMR